MQDDEIKNYIDLFINEEIENGRDPDDMSLKDTIKVYNLRLTLGLLDLLST